MSALVVSGFPGVGKTRFVSSIRHTYSIDDPKLPIVTSISESGMRVMDSDSSHFSWLEPGIRNPFFPRNYIEHILANMDSVDIIFVSSHAGVREALLEAEIEFWLVYPRIETKEEYLKRYADRGSDDQFVQLLDVNWNQWVSECEAMIDAPGVQLMPLGAGQYLRDWLHNYPHEDPAAARKRLILNQCKDDLDYTQ